MRAIEEKADCPHKVDELIFFFSSLGGGGGPPGKGIGGQSSSAILVKPS